MTETTSEKWAGFQPPEQNWSRLPHEFIDAMPLIATKGELQVILYVLRHTWGFQDERKRITLDEFENGRKRRDGSRMDNGCGASRPAITKGIQYAVEHGFLIVEIEGDDARPRHYYRLRNVTAEVTEHDHGSNETCPRSEKETVESKHEETHADNSRQVDEEPEIEPAPEPKPKPLTLQELKADLEEHFSAVTGVPRPKLNTQKQRKAAGALWYKPLVDIADVCDRDPKRTKNLIDWTVVRMRKEKLTIYSPKSIVATAVGEQARRLSEAGLTKPLQPDDGPQRKVMSDEEGEEFRRQLGPKLRAKQERVRAMQEGVPVG